VRRREFISLLGGAAAWPLAARAQQGERMRRIGVLMNATEDSDQQANLAAFTQALQQMGWTEGRNVQIETRWAGGSAPEIRRHAGELVALAPDVILATGTAANLRDAGEIERGVTKFAAATNGGLIVTASALSVVNGALITALAARHKLPTVYYRRYFVTTGGLVSYGYDAVAQFRGAASYVDRILKGEKPSNLPVQAPTKYELVLNLKTAKALGLEVPATVLARADEVIE
jgi:ABC-type uncharacterized transport system substrate-binding protein